MITDAEVLRLFERADPARRDDVAPEPDAAGFLATLRDRSSTVTLIEPEPLQTSPSGRRRRWLIAAAAAVVAAIVAGLVLIVSDDDSSDRQVPVEKVETTVPVTDAPSAAEAVALDYLRAGNAHDADRMLTYLSDELVADSGGADEFRRFEALLAATRFMNLDIACDTINESTEGTTVSCTYDRHGFRSDELGRGPFEVVVEYTVRDGTIVGETERVGPWDSGFSDEMWVPFAAFVKLDHPDDVSTMYPTPRQDGAETTEEAIGLFDERIREYVELQTSPIAFGQRADRICTAAKADYAERLRAAGFDPDDVTSLDASSAEVRDVLRITSGIITKALEGITAMTPPEEVAAQYEHDREILSLERAWLQQRAAGHDVAFSRGEPIADQLDPTMRACTLGW